MGGSSKTDGVRAGEQQVGLRLAGCRSLGCRGAFLPGAGAALRKSPRAPAGSRHYAPDSRAGSPSSAWAQLPVPPPSERRIASAGNTVLGNAGSGPEPWAAPAFQPSQKPPFLGVEERTPCLFPQAGDFMKSSSIRKGVQDGRKTVFTEPSRSLVPTDCGIAPGSPPIPPFIHRPQFSPNGNSIVG